MTSVINSWSNIVILYAYLFLFTLICRIIQLHFKYWDWRSGTAWSPSESESSNNEARSFSRLVLQWRTQACGVRVEWFNIETGSKHKNFPGLQKKHREMTDHIGKEWMTFMTEYCGKSHESLDVFRGWDGLISRDYYRAPIIPSNESTFESFSNARGLSPLFDCEGPDPRGVGGAVGAIVFPEFHGLIRRPCGESEILS